MITTSDTDILITSKLPTPTPTLPNAPIPQVQATPLATLQKGKAPIRHPVADPKNPGPEPNNDLDNTLTNPLAKRLLRKNANGKNYGNDLDYIRM